MTTSKKIYEIKKLWKDLGKNSTITKRYKTREDKKVNIGFVNQYTLHSFIPNKWFDWENRVNAEIMIIGQDWGPYRSLLPYIERYNKERNRVDFNYEEFLFKTFSSRTEKYIFTTLSKTYREKYGRDITNQVWEKFIFTVAVLFTRQDKHFRGSEFYDESFGMKESLPYLKRQIEIVNPRVLITMGGTAWNQIKNIYNLKYPGKFSEVILKLNRKPIVYKDIKIIPIFHPASFTDPKKQYKLWKTLWDNV